MYIPTIHSYTHTHTYIYKTKNDFDDFELTIHTTIRPILRNTTSTNSFLYSSETQNINDKYIHIIQCALNDILPEDIILDIEDKTHVLRDIAKWMMRVKERFANFEQKNDSKSTPTENRDSMVFTSVHTHILFFFCFNTKGRI